jgi:hypothetical protein
MEVTRAEVPTGPAKRQVAEAWNNGKRKRNTLSVSVKKRRNLVAIFMASLINKRLRHLDKQARIVLKRSQDILKEDS